MRLEALSRELGIEGVGLKRLEEELEGDWDEEGFDRIVRRIVDEDQEVSFGLLESCYGREADDRAD